MAFAIAMESGWPPVSSESVWCEDVGGNYRLVNTPFFNSGLAFGDVFSAEPDPENNRVTDFEIIAESGHSVIRLVYNAGERGGPIHLARRAHERPESDLPA